MKRVRNKIEEIVKKTLREIGEEELRSDKVKKQPTTSVDVKSITTSLAAESSKFKKKKYPSTSKYAEGFVIDPRINTKKFLDKVEQTKGVSRDVADRVLETMEPDGYYVEFLDSLTVSLKDFEKGINKVLFPNEETAKREADKMVKLWDAFLERYYKL